MELLHQTEDGDGRRMDTESRRKGLGLFDGGSWEDRTLEPKVLVIFGLIGLTQMGKINLKGN